MNNEFCYCDQDCEATYEQCKNYIFENFCSVCNGKYAGAFLTRDGEAVYIKHVIYRKPYVIILWNDNTKSSAKCLPADMDKYSWEAGLNMAINNKLYGYEEMRNLYEDWLPDSYYVGTTLDGIYEVDIKNVRYMHKEKEKAIDAMRQNEAIESMVEYLKRNGYKVTKSKQNND